MTDPADQTLVLVRGTRTCSVEPTIASFPVNGGFAQLPDTLLSLGDFNRDGKLDALLFDQTSSSLAVLPGTSVQQLGAPIFTVLPFTPNYLAVHDVNNDRTADVVMSSDSGLWVALGDGAGKFGTPTLAGGLSVAVTFVSLADVNHDGKIDLIASDAQGLAYVLLGHGDGTFAAARSFALPGPSYWQAVGDFTGDGRVDLAVSTSKGLVIFLNEGNGEFRQGQVLPAEPSVLVAADMKGDGTLDLVTQSEIFRGRGDGTFECGRRFGETQNTFMQVGDVNGDGIPDIVTSNVAGTISVYSGTCEGRYRLDIYANGNVGNGALRIGNFGGGRESVAVVSATFDELHQAANNSVQLLSRF